MATSLIGQWRGVSKNGWVVIANLGPLDDSFHGRVSVFQSFIHEGQEYSFWTWYYLTATQVGEHEIEGELSPPSIHKHITGELLSGEEIEELHAKVGLELPTRTRFRGQMKGEYELAIEWTSDYPTVPSNSDSATLIKGRLASSKVHHEQMRWHEFKEYALGQNDGLVYRGQPRHWRLQTSYHRTGYADIISYLDDTVPELEKYINSVSKHEFNSKDDRDLGALLNLAQHHGYPTPLLDWTRSPYVAAFFAFEDKSRIKTGGSVSVFSFNAHRWARMVGNVAQLRVPNVVIRTVDLPVFGNSRALPQQSMTMFSNINDIEAVIADNERSKGDFLKAIAIPAQDRDAAMRDLALMGITWGSMFPDLDGICKQLAVRHFP
jgi:hypothetical protein